MRVTGVRCCPHRQSTRSSSTGRRAVDCGHVFSAGERVAVGEPACHQVEELPLINVMVSEHRAQRVCCPECGRRTCAALPGEVARSSFGPRLKRRSRRCRSATASPAMTLSSSSKSSSAPGSARVRWTRSSPGPLRRWPSPTRIFSAGCAPPGTEHGRDGLAHRRGASCAMGDVRSPPRLLRHRARPARGLREGAIRPTLRRS